MEGPLNFPGILGFIEVQALVKLHQPQVLPPPGDALNVQQMPRRNVVGGDVFPSRTATQRERGIQSVEKAADRSLRRSVRAGEKLDQETPRERRSLAV